MEKIIENNIDKLISLSTSFYYEVRSIEERPYIDLYFYDDKVNLYIYFDETDETLHIHIITEFNNKNFNLFIENLGFSINKDDNEYEYVYIFNKKITSDDDLFNIFDIINKIDKYFNKLN